MMIAKAAEKIDIRSLSEEANKFYAKSDSDDSEIVNAYKAGFQRCIKFIEDRKLEGVGFQQLIYELGIISDT